MIDDVLFKPIPGTPAAGDYGSCWEVTRNIGDLVFSPVVSGSMGWDCEKAPIVFPIVGAPGAVWRIDFLAFSVEFVIATLFLWGLPKLVTHYSKSIRFKRFFTIASRLIGVLYASYVILQICLVVAYETRW